MAGQLKKFLKEYDFEYLNEAQLEAVQHVNGAALLFSVPGSGKTTVIVARTGYMVKVMGIAPSNILVITFTKAAASEMKQRYIAKFGCTESNCPDFRTIHSFCYKIIREAAYECEAEMPEIIDNSYTLISGIARSHGVYLEKEVSDSIIAKITEAKNRMMDEKTIREISIEGLDPPLTFEIVFKEYKTMLRENHQMDRDDLLVYAYGFMRKYPRVLERLQRKYTYVSVDEAQDTSPLQHKILECFCARSGNIFMVGDDDQSIYGFRGAEPEELRLFTQRYRDARSLTMNINYRSDSLIVDTAERFICDSPFHTVKNMRSQSKEKGSILYPLVKDPQEQLQYLKKEIQDAISSNNSIAILYRQNVSGYALRYMLNREGIGYNLLTASDTVTENRTVRDVLRLLDFACAPRDFVKFRNCYSNLGLYLKKEDLNEAEMLSRYYPKQDILISLAQHGLQSFSKRYYDCNSTLRYIVQAEPIRALRAITDDLKYDKLKSAQAQLAFEFLKTVARDHADIQSFARTIRALDDNKRKPLGQQLLTLSTLHSCKGLEFDRVIMIDLIEDIIPGKSEAAKRAKQCLDIEEKKHLYREEDKRVEEEARLFYVGATRARHQLQMLFCDKMNDDSKNEPSSLLLSYRGTKDGTEEKQISASVHSRTMIKNTVSAAQPAARRIELKGYFEKLYPYGIPDKK